MKVAYTLMRIQEFYVLHKGKIKVMVSDDRASKVLSYIALSKYPTLEVVHGATPGIFHKDEGFNPMMIWNEEDFEQIFEGL